MKRADARKATNVSLDAALVEEARELDIKLSREFEFPTRRVAPLARPASLSLPATRLDPTFEIDGEALIMLTQQLGAVPNRSLEARVASLERHRTGIIGAIDFLLGRA